MRIEAIWRELEAEATTGSLGAWLTRFALPDPRNTLLIGLESASMERVLLLPLSSASIPPRREWPRYNGLELITVQVEGRPHFGVRLLDTSYRDIFTALAEDLAPRLLAATDERMAARILLDRLRRWQRFLAARSAALSLSRQRGLFGELHFLRNVLAPNIGIEAAVNGWRAALAAHQDFQFASAAIEVKTTTAKQPQGIRITSERQLDDTGTSALFLYVVILDERSVEPGAVASGETLPESIAALRADLGIGTGPRDTFDDRLLDAGYLDSDASQFELRRYSSRAHQCFRIGPGFPRLTEADLPAGVGDVSYLLSIAACAPYTAPVATMLSAISGSASGGGV